MPEETPKYPLYDSPERLRAFSGRPLTEITDEAARAGQLSMADLRVSAETLRAQAEVARAAGYDGLAGNLARAAELTIVPNGEILAMYAYLRPGRATQEQLLNMAEALEKQYQAVECARLVREADAVYQQRGLLARSPSR